MALTDKQTDGNSQFCVHFTPETDNTHHTTHAQKCSQSADLQKARFFFLNVRNVMQKNALVSCLILELFNDASLTASIR